IEEVLKEYREARISEGEYLNKMQGIVEDYRKGDSGIAYPSSIKNEPHAQAFYGVIKEQVYEVNEDRGLYEPMADLSLQVKSIIDKHVKVDFHDNTDIHNRIAQEIDDLLFDFKKENNLELSIDQIDKIIEKIKSISVKRY
ncbi:MAG: hypothetical protein ACNA7I_05420, partial [Candidatus Methanoperedens sp.]